MKGHVSLTAAERETLWELHADGWANGFALEQAFTARDNHDNGARRCLRRLVLKGLVVPTGDQIAIGNSFLPRYRLTSEALLIVADEDERRLDAES